MIINTPNGVVNALRSNSNKAMAERFSRKIQEVEADRDYRIKKKKSIILLFRRGL